MTLLFTNGVLNCCLAPLDCEREAERINNNFHYSQAWAICAVTNEVTK